MTSDTVVDLDSVMVYGDVTSTPAIDGSLILTAYDVKVSDVLDTIGEDRAREYFGIEEK